MDSLANMRVCNLAQTPWYAHILARWHHDEWLRACTKPPAKDVIKKRLHEREKNLLTHTSCDHIPMTLVAVLDGLPIGSVSLVYYQFAPLHTRQEWLTNLYVHVDCRRRGVASKLLTLAESYASNNNVQRLRLYTRDQSEFYLNRGWTTAGQGRVQGQSVTILIKQLPCDISAAHS